MTDAITDRLAAAKRIARVGGDTALAYFRDLSALTIEPKGHQDMVSEADRNVETEIRTALATAFPDDGITGEEHAPVAGSSGYTWVIDPIDGTANFVADIPAWVVVLACVHNAKTVIGVIHDPIHDMTWWARAGGGAFGNDKPIRVAGSRGINNGSVGTGFSNRTAPGAVEALVAGIRAEGGVFHRNASGALSLAYVASGKLIGYAEDHMNAWDCLAGQLLVHEAGGVIEDQNADDMIANGGRVIAATPTVFDDLQRISLAAFGD